MATETKDPMPRKIFSCANCGIGGEQELTECRVCRRTFCSECVNKEGTCVPCQRIND